MTSNNYLKEIATLVPTKEKYIKFYKTLDKRFKNNDNLILHSISKRHGGVDP